MAFSIEFFPPKTSEGFQKLQKTYERLVLFKPEYFSVTFGAGGSTQQGTLDSVLFLKQAGQRAAPHLSCIGSSAQSIQDILHSYQIQGIHHLVVLRGDLPSGYGGMHAMGEFRYASELVRYIRQQSGDYFHIEVAAYPEIHPQASSFDTDVKYFVQKVQAGANSAITQYFYNADAYFYFVETVRKLGVDIPIVPGIMPINNLIQLKRFSDLCGAQVPRWILLKLESYGEDLNSLRAFGLEVVTRLCERLLAGGAPSLHFYSLNQAEPTEKILKNLEPLKTHS